MSIDINRIFSIVHRQSQVFHTQKLKNLGLTSGSFMYILYICEMPGMTQDQLSVKLQIDKGTVAKTLQQLLSDGYISRKSSLEDRRVNNLFPAAKALDIYPELLKIRQLWHKHILSNYSDLEAELFLKLLDKLPLQHSDSISIDFEDH